MKAQVALLAVGFLLAACIIHPPAEASAQAQGCEPIGEPTFSNATEADYHSMADYQAGNPYRVAVVPGINYLCKPTA